MIPSRGLAQVTLDDDSGAASGTARAIDNAINSGPNNNISQVKILRRPKPVAIQSQNHNNLNNNTEVILSQQSSMTGFRIASNQLSDNRLDFNQDNKGNNIRNENKQQNGLLLFKNKSSVNTKGPSNLSDGHKTLETSTPITNHYDDKQKTLSHTKGCSNKASFQIEQPNHNYNGDSDSKFEQIVTNNVTKHQAPIQKQQQQPNNDRQRDFNDINNGQVFNKSKHLMKTYQERADQYARARLRILGSAFPEDEHDGLLNLTNSDEVNRILNVNSNFNDNTTTIDNNKISSSSNNNIMNNSLNLEKTKKSAPTYSSVTAANVSHQQDINKQSNHSTVGQPLIMGTNNSKLQNNHNNTK